MFIGILFVFILPLVRCEDDVKIAVVIYRHGDRTPVDPYPTDPWRNQSLWPVKFGQLTNIGKRQHYALGKWLRKLYSHLLSDQYDPSEIYIRSTDVDRTIMSAQANLAGMYPPEGSSIWDGDLLWQPIPIHTVPENLDAVLAMKKYCAAYDKEMHKFTHSKSYKERLSKYQGLMDYLTAYTGRKIKDYSGIEFVYNTLYIESLYNFTLPNWTLNYYPEKMLEPARYSFTIATATPTLARLKVGPLLKEITSKMALSVNATQKEDQLKMVAYSAHDDTVSSVLNALGIFDHHCPSYTATILMELLEGPSGHSVRISYKNSTEIDEPRVLTIPYCGKSCPFERFVQLYKNLIQVDWERECSVQIIEASSHFFGTAFFLGLGVIVLVYTAHKVYFARVASLHRLGTGYSNVEENSFKPVKLVEKENHLFT